MHKHTCAREKKGAHEKRAKSAPCHPSATRALTWRRARGTCPPGPRPPPAAPAPPRPEGRCRPAGSKPFPSRGRCPTGAARPRARAGGRTHSPRPRLGRPQTPTSRRCRRAGQSSCPSRGISHILSTATVRRFGNLFFFSSSFFGTLSSFFLSNVRTQLLGARVAAERRGAWEVGGAVSPRARAPAANFRARTSAAGRSHSHAPSAPQAAER